MADRVLFDRAGSKGFFDGLAMIVPAVFFGCVAVLVSRQPDPLFLLISGPLALVAIGLIFVAARHRYGRERLAIEDDQLRSTTCFGPFGRDCRVPLAEVRAIGLPARGREMSRHASGPGVPVLRILSRDSRFLCGFGLTPVEGERLAAALCAELKERGLPVPAVGRVNLRGAVEPD